MNIGDKYSKTSMPAVFLKARIIILIIPLLFLPKLLVNYHSRINEVLGKDLGDFFFDIRQRCQAINYTVERFILIADGKLFLIGRALLMAGFLFIFVLLVHFLFRYFARRVFEKTLFIYSRFIAIACILSMGSLFYLSLPIGLTAAVVFIVMFMYLLDFIYFEYKEKSLNKHVITKLVKAIVIFLPGIGELLFAPFYLIFSGWIRAYRNNRLFALLRHIHFACIYILVFIMIIPLKAETVQVVDTLQTYGDSGLYGQVLSEKNSKLFVMAASGRRIISLNIDDNNKVISVQGSYPDCTEQEEFRLSEVFDISEERQEIYLVDKGRKLFIIVDSNDCSEKSSLYSDGFRFGDSRIRYAEGFVYVINDDPHFIFKIDPKIPEIIIQIPFKTYNGVLEYNKVKNVLYTAEWLYRGEPGENIDPDYFIYELDTLSLGVYRKIKIPGGCWQVVVSEDGKRLFCALPFAGPFRSYVYVIDADSFEVIDKIKVPLGTRAIALDDERNLLFAGSIATNLVEIIDLDTKKILKTYKAGPFYLRAIVLDKKRNSFYITSRNSGLFKGNY
ncbi:MAG: hypothetical protein JW734_08565 [Candidatus Omnitrophica bacterium]|nr:hypothetical protein [Candidatus Omnitrophota bacterium]